MTTETTTRLGVPTATGRWALRLMRERNEWRERCLRAEGKRGGIAPPSLPNEPARIDSPVLLVDRAPDPKRIVNLDRARVLRLVDDYQLAHRPGWETDIAASVALGSISPSLVSEWRRGQRAGRPKIALVYGNAERYADALGVPLGDILWHNGGAE